MATSRSSIPKRTDAAKLRREQQAIAEDVVRRERIRTEGDIAAPRPPVSPPEQGVQLPRRRRQRRISSQGIAGFGKPNVTI